ncbi:hypothetical protein [Anoxynatronum sibiricum]|uniref:Uncharacterized protein n=1 Tax=Anoxynatronum sibiricum TaxID=210623 RepID=A0ABU9VWA9_9CLOT
MALTAISTRVDFSGVVPVLRVLHNVRWIFSFVFSGSYCNVGQSQSNQAENIGRQISV